MPSKCDLCLNLNLNLNLEPDRQSVARRAILLQTLGIRSRCAAWWCQEKLGGVLGQWGTLLILLVRAGQSDACPGCPGHVAPLSMG